MPRKLKALRAHRSQLHDFDYVRAITGLNQYRGVVTAKCRFAEVFLEKSWELPRRNPRATKKASRSATGKPGSRRSTAPSSSGTNP
jgi:hypothetical protein